LVFEVLRFWVDALTAGGYCRGTNLFAELDDGNKAIISLFNSS
jgi:hypothetical protein